MVLKTLQKMCPPPSTQLFCPWSKWSKKKCGTTGLSKNHPPPGHSAFFFGTWPHVPSASAGTRTGVVVPGAGNRASRCLFIRLSASPPLHHALAPSRPLPNTLFSLSLSLSLSLPPLHSTAHAHPRQATVQRLRQFEPTPPPSRPSE